MFKFSFQNIQKTIEPISNHLPHIPLPERSIPLLFVIAKPDPNHSLIKKGKDYLTGIGWLSQILGLNMTGKIAPSIHSFKN